MEQVSLVSDVDAMEDDGRGRVTLITLHSAKGLEFPVVFITGVEEGLLPINRAIEAEFYDAMPLEEERRLFYVGITRAQRLLYLTYAGHRVTYGRFQPAVASRFLGAIPEGNVQNLGRRGPSFASSGRGNDRLQDRVKRPSTADALTPGPAPTLTVPTAPTVAYAAGQRVFHPKFGEGTVAETADRRDDQEVVVDFVRHPRKPLMASLAAMDVIE